MTFLKVAAKMANIQDRSAVQELYYGANVFITGGTGSLGKLVIEKLLRSCPRINKIYVLCRGKKEKQHEGRLDEQFDSILYDLVRKTDPEFKSKIIPVLGDCSCINLGINQEDIQTLLNEINIIFHCAATIRFDEPLRKAVHINVRATRDLMFLARGMTQLKAFVHVSTAYSNCVHYHIDEKLYEPPFDGDKLITLVDLVDEHMLNSFTTRLIGEYPNTYAYTKAVAEHVVKQNSNGLPICIVRPSIIIPTSKEPFPGWGDKVYGPIGVVIGVLRGILHTWHSDKNKIAALVPGDYVANICIVAASEVTQTSTNSKSTHEDTDGMPIYNYTGCPERAITWGAYAKEVVECSSSLPALNSLWTYFLILTKYRFVYLLQCFFLHLVPAYILDTLLFLIGKQPSLIKNYSLIHKTIDLVSYFGTREWKFETENTQNLYAKLNDTDKKLFNFDMSKMSWSEYMESYVAGARIHILKDPLTTVPRAKRRYTILRAVNKVLFIILMCFFYYLWVLLYQMF